MNRTDDENRELQSPGERFGQRFRKNLSAENLQDSIISHETEAVSRTFAELSETGSVQQAAALLLGARRKFVGGEGKSAAYAQLLTADLTATLSNIFYIDGRGHTSLSVLSDVRTSDVLVLFLLRRYRTETVRLGELFHSAGGKLVLITDSVDAPLTDIADATVTVYTGSASYADSPTAVAAVCHLLSALTSASAKGARRRLAVRDQLAQDLGLYAKASRPEAAEVQQTRETPPGSAVNKTSKLKDAP
jgi:DNA-binding MurR/RpiR family transcriptional regulator